MGRDRQLYRDRDQAKIAGVCAGVAEYFGWNVKFTRVGWIVATCLWPPVMITAYILMIWLVDPRPAAGYGNSYAPAQPWPTDPLAPRRRFVDVRSRFDRLEDRLRSLETAVTSREFQIDRELKA